MDGMPHNRENYELIKNSVFHEIERLSHFARKVEKLANELKDISRNIVYNTSINIPLKSKSTKREKLKNLDNEENREIWNKVENQQKSIFANLSEIERNRMNKEKAQLIAIETYLKLTKAGYTDTMINQAIYNACSDSFWAKQFRSYAKLYRKNKDGVFYIDVFLSLNQKSHKIAVPKIIR